MRVEQDMVINAPVARVYELWTDFEQFPRFMSHVESVKRTGENTLHWKAKIGPLTKEWDAEIKGLVENRTVSWHSTEGADNAGAITLAERGHVTEMHVVIEYHPNLFETLAETVTHELSRSVEADLQHFKALAEGRPVQGTTAAPSGYHYEEATENAGYTGSDRDHRDHQGAAVPNSTLSSRSDNAMSNRNDATDETAGTPARESLDRDTEATGGAYTTHASDMTDLGHPTLDTGADNDGSTSGSARIVSRVEIEGLGSDESPGDAVGSTSMEEIAAARAALGGTPDTATGGATGSTTGSAMGGTNDSASAGTTSPIAAGGGTSGSSAGGPTGGGTMGGSSGTMGGTLPNDPTGGTGSVTTGSGPLGPSLMTYEAGSAPDMAGGSSTDVGGGGLGSLTEDRTSVGSTTVSSGSYVDRGRTGDTGGMTDTDSGPTTSSTSSLAGSGNLGGGGADLGGQATTPALGSHPHGGGTGRGTGDAYGSGVASDATMLPGLGSARLGVGDGAGDNTPGGELAGGDVAGRDLGVPATDISSGGTGASYTGGTGGWGNDDPASAEATNWTPSSNATGLTGLTGDTGSTSGSETH